MKTIIIVLIMVYFGLLFSIKAVQYLRRGKNEKKKVPAFKNNKGEQRQKQEISSRK